MPSKRYGKSNVYNAAVERLEYVLSHFGAYYVAFSGGKDSGVLLNLMVNIALKRGRAPVHVLFVDMEAQYQHTIDFIDSMSRHPNVIMHWVCLPLSLRNASSQYEPKWVCWEPEKESLWIRPLPTRFSSDTCHIISDHAYFPFYRFGMEFEEFVLEYSEWFAQHFNPTEQPTCCLVAIRSDESLNRYRTIKNQNKRTFLGHTWTTQAKEGVYLAYPIYDWCVEDIWTANGRFSWPYNKIYDLMYKAGVTLSAQRLCQPFGDNQRKGLWLYHTLEPITWAKLVSRVEGCHFGARYSKQQGRILGYYKFDLPKGHTYKTYSKFLLDSMPPHLSAHYRQRIFQFLLWWKNHGKHQGIYRIADAADKKLEAQKKVPSWRRICKVLIKNDYWCTGLSFSQTKQLTDSYLELYRSYLNHR